MGSAKRKKRISLDEILSGTEVPTVSKNVEKHNIKEYNLYRITKMGIYSEYKLFTQDIRDGDLFIALTPADSYGWIRGVIIKNGELKLAAINPYQLDFLARMVGDLTPIYELEKLYEERDKEQDAILAGIQKRVADLKKRMA